MVSEASRGDIKIKYVKQSLVLYLGEKVNLMLKVKTWLQSSFKRVN